jgi:hypothetical protein
MIIGINGYIGSGKDTVGKIIQYLECKTKYSGEPDFHWDGMFKDIHTSWRIKKFAGKLKEIASIMTGIPIEKFEDQEFKKTYLGEEWSTLIYEGDNGYFNSDAIVGKERMTVREFLQKLGTEAIRVGLHTNAWVNALFADYRAIQYHDGGRFYDKGEYPNWIITDTRFPNEAQAIKNRGGIVVRVNRSMMGGQGGTLADSHMNIHPSETSLDNWNFDYVLENDGSIEELIPRVKEMLEKFDLL